MATAPRFTRNPNSVSQRRAAALANADALLHESLVRNRREQGLTQAQVAALMGVTQPTVAQFERYDNDPRLSTMRRYAHAVGVVVSHNVSREGVEVPAGWTPVAPAVSFSIGSTTTAVAQMPIAAPDSARVDFALAA